MKLLEEAEDEMHQPVDDVVNASQALPGFAFLAAGGRKAYQPERDCKPLMINHKHTDAQASRQARSSTQRSLDLKKWFRDHRILYILNLAQTDPDMGEYPLDNTLEIIPGTAAEEGDFDVAEDEDDDERVRVLSLPMRDDDEYDMGTCQHLATAGSP